MSYQTLNITNQEFNQISNLVYELFGIYLPETKKTLVKSRLNNYLVRNGFRCFKEYYNSLLVDNNHEQLLVLIDKLSTNYTFFFREVDHYQFMINTILPALEESLKYSKEKKIRIWSAGCSSGEEAYTIAMVLDDYLGINKDKWDIGILATDICTTALEKAQNGVYSNTSLKDVAVTYKHRYFELIDGSMIKVKDHIKDMVTFRRLNLMRDEFPFKCKFNVIFCRNVMIYFNKESRGKLEKKFYQNTSKDGYLFIGHSESLPRGQISYKYVKPSIYIKE